MPSPSRSDTWFGLAVAAALVAAAGWAAVVIDRHAEEHGHHAPLALIDVERAQRGQLDVGGGADVVGVVHASFFAMTGVSDAVRRRRDDSDRRK